MDDVSRVVVWRQLVRMLPSLRAVIVLHGSTGMSAPPSKICAGNQLFFFIFHFLHHGMRCVTPYEPSVKFGFFSVGVSVLSPEIHFLL